MSDDTTTCVNSTTIACTDTAVSGENIVTGLYINAILGLICYFAFVAWRGELPCYYAREVLPGIKKEDRPPRQRLGGHWQLWSWIIPAIKVSDKKLLESCGLDAWVALRIIAFGVALFVPYTVFGIGLLLPITYTAYDYTNSSETSYDTAFIRMGMSNIPNGSSLFWIHFVVLYGFVFWACYLIIIFYQEHIAVRQTMYALTQNEIKSQENAARAGRVSGALPKVNNANNNNQETSAVKPHRLADTEIYHDATDVVHPPGSSPFQEDSAEPDHGNYAIDTSGVISIGPDMHSKSGFHELPIEGTTLDESLQGDHHDDDDKEKLPVTTKDGVSDETKNGGDGKTKKGVSFAATDVPTTEADKPTQMPSANMMMERLDTLGPQDKRPRLPKFGVKSPEDLDYRARLYPVPPVHQSFYSKIIVPRTGPYTVIVMDQTVSEYKVRSKGMAGMVPRFGRLKTLQSVQKSIQEKDKKWYSSLVDRRGVLGGRLVKKNDDDDIEAGDTKEPTIATETPEEEAEGVSTSVMNAKAQMPPVMKRLLSPFHGIDSSDELRMASIIAKQNAELNPVTPGSPAYQPAAGVKETSAEKLARETQLRQSIITSTYTRLFGDDFDHVIPVYETKRVDALLTKCYKVQAQAERVSLALYEAQEAIAAGKPVAPYCSKSFSVIPPMTSKNPQKLQKQLTELLAKESALQDEIAAAQKEVMAGTPCRSFIVTFKTQKAAAMALNININPINYRIFQVVKGTDANNICWTTLQRSWMERNTRFIITLFPIILLMLFPVGIFTGFFAQIDAALCGNGYDTTGSASGTWFCSDDMWATLLRNLLTSLLPSILMTVWQTVVVPLYLYACAISESKSYTLTQVEARLASLFFYWNVFNFFIGSLLGGAATNSVKSASSDDTAEDIWNQLANSVITTSNFFINYVIYRTLAMGLLRIFFPGAFIVMLLIKWFRLLPKARTKRDKLLENPPRNCRYSRDIGVIIMAIYICSMAYALVTPIILPVALLFYLFTYWIWRYQMLYVFTEAYHSDGVMWKFFAHRLIACLILMVVFTSSIFIFKAAYVQAGIAFITLLIFLICFDQYVRQRYDSVFDDEPMAILEAAPKVSLDPVLYTPPPLRDGAQGWYLEWGKAWNYWAATRYSV